MTVFNSSLATVVLIITSVLLSLSLATATQPLQLAIHDIQGNGSISPHVGLSVITTGIVTGVKNNGFFLQAPDSQADSDPNTSEGIFVFTSQPPSVSTSQEISITGTVQEFRPSSEPNGLPLTEIINPVISLMSQSRPLPGPVTLTLADTRPDGPLDQLEKYEGMRVRIERLVTVSPTGGFLNEQNAVSTSNGVFFGVIDGIARPVREPGLEPFNLLPSGAPCCIPRFDGNPERLRVDTRALNGNLPGVNPIDVTTGTIVTPVTGPLDYAAANYTILQDPPPVTPRPLLFARDGTTIINAVPVSAPAADEFTVASFNMERFFDTTNDPSTSDVVLTQAAFDARLNKASLAVRNVMRSPDIIGVEEVENLPALQAIAAKINNDAVASGSGNPNYLAFLSEGNDPGGIDVGFLVKAAKVSMIDVAQIGKDATYVDPINNQTAILNDRPSLVLSANVQQPSGGAFQITVIVNHLRSLLGLDDAMTGARVRAKRKAQAEFLASYIQSRQTANPNERIISVGDYNSFQFNDGFVDVIGAIRGAPAPATQVLTASNDLVNPDLLNLIDLLPSDQRYSFSFDGNAQAIDHILITSNLFPHVRRLEFARNNADFPETMRGVASRPERISDHDVPVAYFGFTPAPAHVTSVSAASYSGFSAAGESIIAAFGSGLAASTEIATSLPLPTVLAGVSVRIKDRLDIERFASLFFVSPNQINYLMPSNIATGLATVTVTRDGAANSAGRVVIEPVAPGLFSANANGRGVAAATVLRVRADGSQQFEPVARFDQTLNQFVPIPIDLGAETDQVFLILFATGVRNRNSLAGVAVSIGSVDSQVLYAGAQGTFAGLDQINVRLQRSLIGSGEVDVNLRVDGKIANVLRVSIKNDATSNSVKVSFK